MENAKKEYVGRTEFNGYDWVFKLAHGFYANVLLQKEVVYAVKRWMADDGPSFGELMPPSNPSGPNEPCDPYWNMVLDGQNIVATPAWCYRGARSEDTPDEKPTLEPRTVGSISEEIMPFADSRICSLIRVGFLAMDEKYIDHVIDPRLGFKSEVMKWRDDMRRALGA